LIEGALALYENRLDVAERLLKAHLKDDPFDAAAIRMLAELAARIGRLKDAETLLRRAVEIAPGFTAARANLAMVLGRAGRPAEALELLDDIVRDQPDTIGSINLRAATLGRLGDFDRAIKLYEAALAKTPRQPAVWLSYGHMLKTIGRQSDGIAAYRKAIALKPTLGEAWWSLANLKTVRFNAADMKTMQGALAEEGLRPDDRFHLDFALGKAMHDAGRYGEAFDHYAAGNALRREFHRFDEAKLAARAQRSIALFTAAELARGGGCDAPDPIFIVGLPRAGSTLVEQILASHPLVEGTSELPDIPALARERNNYPDYVPALSDAERRELGERYLARASVQRRTDRPFFIDKLPNNWLFVPFILQILPNAKIVDVRRHPLGCCFANFRQHFARGQDFTYDLPTLGRYYAHYVRLMAHIDAVMPGRVHRVLYERIVDDTEQAVRTLLDHCGLAFDPACLEFHRTERAVRTASSEQVRQPIYRDATEEWQHYDEHLGPLRDALGEIVDVYPAAPASLLQR